MKLLFCPDCHDVKGLVMTEWRTCLCGRSGGQYNKDGMTATIGGRVRIFGVGNPFFDPLYPYLMDTGHASGLKLMQKDMYGHQKGDAWWGEYEGDVQLFRIKSPDGPRLKIEIRELPGDETHMVVTIKDKRDYWVGKTFRQLEVAVPVTPKVKFTRWDKRKKNESNSTSRRKKSAVPGTLYAPDAGDQGRKTDIGTVRDAVLAAGDVEKTA